MRPLNIVFTYWPTVLVICPGSQMREWSIGGILIGRVRTEELVEKPVPMPLYLP
jgi:hypothetical protein